MKVCSYKKCDKCGETVAKKSLLYHTVKDYVTVRLDEVPGYSCMEDNTVASKLHYCFPCWMSIVNGIKEGRQ